jgi:hypothetical protein
MLESLQMVAVVWDTELPDVKFAIPSVEVCAFDRQFGEHPLSACSGLCAVGLPFFFLSFEIELSYLRVDRQEQIDFGEICMRSAGMRMRLKSKREFKY